MPIMTDISNSSMRICQTTRRDWVGARFSRRDDPEIDEVIGELNLNIGLSSASAKHKLTNATRLSGER